MKPEDTLQKFLRLADPFGDVSNEALVEYEALKAKILEALEFYEYADKMGYIISDGDKCQTIAQTKLIQDNKELQEKAEKSGIVVTQLNEAIEQLHNYKKKSQKLESKVKDLESKIDELKSAI